MLTKNFFNFLMLTSSKGEYSFKTSTGSTMVINASEFKPNADDDEYSIWPLEAIKLSLGDSDAGVSFGSGTTAPTFNDYKLETALTGISVTPPSDLTISETSTYCECSAAFTVHNVSNSSKTISEVGLFARVSTNTSYCDFLAERQVLATPIVLVAGASEQITYKIRFNFPTS